MSVAINNEYSRRYWNLFDMLQQAYMDRYLLEEIEKYADDVGEYEGAYKTRAYSVLGHISSLLKKDLCLTVWKIYCDSDRRANTIRTFNCYLREITGKSYTTKLSKEIQPLAEKLDTMRKQWIAHNDCDKEELSLLTVDIYQMLDEICEMVNGMMDKTVATDVMEFSEATKNALRNRSILGLKEMIYKNDKPVGIVPKD